MNNKIPHIARFMLAIGLLAGQDAMAAKVYQWTDEEGLVHFSDIPPKDNTSTETQEIEFLSRTETGAEPDEYSIVNQLALMSEWRRQTTEERLAKKELQLEAKRIANENNASRYNLPASRTYYQPAYYNPSPVYYPYPGHFSGYKKWHGQGISGNRFGSVKGNFGKFTGASHQIMPTQF